MADAFYSAWMEIVPDFSKVSKEIDDAVQGIGRDFGRAGERAGEAFADRANPAFEGIGRDSGRRFTSGFGKFVSGIGIGSFLGNLASNIVSNIGAAIGSGVRMGIGYLEESVTAASDLSESANAISVAFGDAAGGIEKLATAAAQSKGLSQLDFQGIATQFSAFASTIRGNDVVGFIDELTTRGADFASVYNLEVSEALALFQSGLAGETEPLRKFGIDLSAAAVEAYAYASGIGAAGAPLSEAQKQQARYGLLLQQTAQTAGDFTNTQDSLANQQRILNAEWQNAQAKLGMALLPALTTLANVANDTLVPALAAMIEQVGPGLGQALTDAVPSLVALGTAIVDSLPSLVALAEDALPAIISGLQVLIPWMIDTTAAFANGWTQISTWWSQLMAAFENGANQWGQFFAAVAEVWNSIIGAFANGWSQISAFFTGFGAALANGWNQITRFFGTLGAALANGAAQIGQFASAVGAGVNEAIGFFQSLPSRVQGFFAGAGSWLVSSGRALIQGFIDGISAMVGRVGDAVGNVLSFARGFFPNSPADRGPFSGVGWRQIADSGAAIFDQFTGGFDAQAGALAMPGMSALAPRVRVPRMEAFAAEGAQSGAVVNQTTNIYPQETDPYTLGRVTGNQIARNLTGLGVRK